MSLSRTNLNFMNNYHRNSFRGKEAEEKKETILKIIVIFFDNKIEEFVSN